jgi:hypothetical protein
MLFRTVVGSSMPGAYDRILTRMRGLVVAALLAGLLASLGPSSALAVTGDGAVVGPWSCGPDQQVGLTFHVTGTSGAYVDIDYFYYATWTTEWSADGAHLLPGYTFVSPPVASRTISKFYYHTAGNANLVSWTRSCD